MEDVKEGGDGGVGAKGEGGEVVRVLVVDDSLMDRKIVERMLMRSVGSFEVIAVDSGKKAMEVLGMNEEKAELASVNVQKIDLILTDYCMPELTGYDLLKAVKEHCYTRSLPVVIMSSENVPQRISSCLEVGAEDFLLKPLKVKDVQWLKNFARPMSPAVQSTSKRKLPPDCTAVSNSSERHQRLAGVAVA